MAVQIFYDREFSELTFYGVGGPVDEMYEVDDILEFSDIWAETVSQKIPKLVIGKGSNLLPADSGFRGRVFIPKFEATIWKDNVVTVEAGKNFQAFIEETNEKGFADLCNLSGIPGNVGGFVRGNAGALGSEISDFCVGVEYLDENGILQKLSNKDCRFGYRESIFKEKPDWCVVRGIFLLKKTVGTHCNASLQKTKEILAQRWQKNPGGRSGGCLFKNPEGEIAGRLLDECGAKGDQVGQAQISEKHANFFLNLGGATQADILALARKWQKIVLEKKGIKLEPEIFICDEKGQKIEL